MEVVFDIGNVLLRWDPRNLFRREFADAEACERFLAGPLAMSFILELDVAPSFGDLIAARAAEFPAFARELRMFDARWMETLGGIIEENLALMRRLKAHGARVHALSNFAHEKFAMAAKTYPFLREFDVAVISGCEGVAKPDRRIFELLVERTETPARELFFIDDSPKNVEAARAFGLDAVLYAPGVDLEAKLLQRGLLDA